MKFSIKDFFSKCDRIHRFFADLVIFAEEILNRKHQFLCNAADNFCPIVNVQLVIFLVSNILNLTFNTFHDTGLILYQRFPDIFQGYRKWLVAWNGFRIIKYKIYLWFFFKYLCYFLLVKIQTRIFPHFCTKYGEIQKISP